MPIAPFSETYSKGTHFSDGVRVGPIYPTGYSQGPVGGNFSTPIFNETPADQLRNPGVLLGPEYIYSITPYAAGTDNLLEEPGQQSTGEMWFTLKVKDKTPAGAISLVTLPSPIPLGSSAPGFGVDGLTSNLVNNAFTKAYVFDVSRCVSLTNVGSKEGKTPILTAYGIDQYGFPLASSVTLSSELDTHRTWIFPKSMKALLGIFCNGATTGAYTFSTSDVYGFPYRVDNQSTIFPIWKSAPTYYANASGSSSDNNKVAPLTTLTTLNEPGSNNTVGTIAKQLYAISSTTLDGSLLLADPKPYGVGNLNPTATINGGDVRGLIMLPGYDQAEKAATPVSTYGYGTNQNYYGGDSLVVRMYLAQANATKIGLYSPPQGNLPTPSKIALDGTQNGKITLYGVNSSGAYISESVDLQATITKRSQKDYSYLYSVYNNGVKQDNLLVNKEDPDAFPFIFNGPLDSQSYAPLAYPFSPTPGSPVLVPPYTGAPACIPLEVPTTPVDLYGSPQYWPS